MHFCDITHSYTETSGGIRTYLDAKREYLLSHTDWHHTLIIPGETDLVEETPRTTTYHIAGPHVPGHAPYRLFWRSGKIKRALQECQPDFVELGSFYICPWAAFEYRRQRHEQQMPCVIGSYFHTDVADTVVESPLKNNLAKPIRPWSETVAKLAEKFAGLAESAATSYVGHVFEKSDLCFAASQQQVHRLRAYGVQDAHVVPLGVDTDIFHPDRSSASVRRQWQAGPSDCVLIYAGRLDEEKRINTLVDAFMQLPEALAAHLVLLGDGPLRESLQAKHIPRLHVMGYESDPVVCATYFASADLYVTAGPHETFGLSVVEAQSCGLPVVGVAAGALLERVPSNLGMLAEPDNAADLARCIEQIQPYVSQMGGAARRHVEATFRWGKTFESLLQYYLRALSTQPKQTEGSSQPVYPTVSWQRDK